MKATYTAPEQEIVKFEIEDVITTSGMQNAGNGNWGDVDTGDGSGLFG